MRKVSLVIIIAASVLFLFAGGCRSVNKPGKTSAVPPAQSAIGPGGAEYAHGGLRTFHFGEESEEYWVFTPVDPVPENRGVSVVLFLHGWGGMHPKIYGAWIKHLVRRGNIVIFPRYQASLRTKPAEMTPAVLAVLKDAREQFRDCAMKGIACPEWEEMAAVGHSLGGVIAANIAALSARTNPEIFPPIAVMSVEPGDSKNSKTAKRFNAKVESILMDYSAIAASTKLLCVVGEDDQVAGDAAAKTIFNGATTVPPENKTYIIVRSDDQGTPPLVADHFFPVAPDETLDVEFQMPEPRSGPIRQKIRERLKERLKEKKEHGDGNSRGKVDALDTYGTWRLLDTLMECAGAEAENCDCVLEDTACARAMGKWSAGAAVKELKITKNP